jgi:hypothetical protein
MLLAPSDAWKLVLAVVLLGAIAISAWARAPKAAAPTSELHRLVISALGLYVVGAVAWFTHHLLLAVLVYAAGITIAAVAAWLSRGSDSEDPPDDDGGEPHDEPPSPEPDGVPWFDWAAFERDFRAYSSRGGGKPAGVR